IEGDSRCTILPLCPRGRATAGRGRAISFLFTVQVRSLSTRLGVKWLSRRRRAIRTLNAMKSVVLLSPHFPPATVAGVHRARHLAKHLPAAGWHPIVLCVHEAYYEEALDPDLGRLVPNTVETVKVAAISAGSTRRLGLGDVSLRAFRSLRAALFD